MCNEIGELNAKHEEECLQYHVERLTARSADAYKVGAPAFIGEVGGCGTSDRCILEIAQVLKLASADLMHWSVRTDMLGKYGVPDAYKVVTIAQPSV